MTKKHLLYLALFLNLLVITGFWYSSSNALLTTDANSITLAFARLTGLYAAFFVLLQFVLMGRERWVEGVFGLDKLSQVHRLNGYLSIFFILLHPTLMVISYSNFADQSPLWQIQEFLMHYDDLLQATIAVILFVTIVVSSLYIVFKRLKYEWWYGIHLFTYIAVLLAWGHQLKLGGDFIYQSFVLYWYALYIFVFGNIFFFRILRPLWLFNRYSFRVEKIEKEAKSAFSVYLTGNNIEKFKTTPGQFVSVRFLNKTWWQAHPFSLSFVPKNNQLRLTIKNSGDFTSRISEIRPGTKILLDGPFGSFRLNLSAKKFLFIAGGVGITPIRSHIEQAGEMGKDMVLLYSNKESADIILKKEIDALSKQYNFPVTYIVTSEKTWKGETGRIDAEKIKRLVKDFKQRDIYICGPVTMMKEINKQLISLGIPAKQIHFEKFTLH